MHKAAKIVFYLSSTSFLLLAFMILFSSFIFPSDIYMTVENITSETIFLREPIVDLFVKWSPITAMFFLISSIVSGYFAFFFGGKNVRAKDKRGVSYSVIKDVIVALFAVLGTSFIFSFIYIPFPWLANYTSWIPWTVAYFIVCWRIGYVDYHRLIITSLVLFIPLFLINAMLYTEGSLKSLDFYYFLVTIKDIIVQIVAVFVGSKSYKVLFSQTEKNIK